MELPDPQVLTFTSRGNAVIEGGKGSTGGGDRDYFDDVSSPSPGGVGGAGGDAMGLGGGLSVDLRHIDRSVLISGGLGGNGGLGGKGGEGYNDARTTAHDGGAGGRGGNGISFDENNRRVSVLVPYVNKVYIQGAKGGNGGNGGNGGDAIQNWTVDIRGQGGVGGTRGTGGKAFVGIEPNATNVTGYVTYDRSNASTLGSTSGQTGGRGNRTN